MAVPSSSRRPGLRVPAVAALVVAGVVFVAWWWWPSVARPADRLDVVVVGDGQTLEAQEQIERRIREEGFSVEVLPIEDGSLCSAVESLERLVSAESPTIVVLSPAAAGAGDCTISEAVDAAGTASVVLLVQPGDEDPRLRAEAESLGLPVADPTRLLGVGQPPPVRMGCQWWDDCEADGQVAVRDGDGVLTAAGGERVARVLVGVLP